MTIDLVRGPLDEHWLDAIAKLYGPFNRKYADKEHCRHLFNENPAGPSLHAFAMHPDEGPVGHYALVRMDVLRDGSIRPAGKGEAFVVHEAHRTSVVSVDADEPIPVGIAMPLNLYRFALAEGVDLVHMMAATDIGFIHRMTGCRSVAIPRERHVLTLGGSPGQGDAARARVQAWRNRLGRLQGTASRMAQMMTFSSLGAARHVPDDRFGAELRKQIVADIPQPAGWGLAIDAERLGWLIRVGQLQLVALDDALDDYALICPRGGEGRVMEVVFWKQRSRSVRIAMRLLTAVVSRSLECNDAQVGVSIASAWESGEQDRLRSSCGWLLFRRREQPANMYVRSDDRYYLDPNHLRFSPFFHAVF